MGSTISTLKRVQSKGAASSQSKRVRWKACDLLSKQTANASFGRVPVPSEIWTEQQRLIDAGDTEQLHRWYSTTPPEHWRRPVHILSLLCSLGHVQAAHWARGYFNLTVEEVKQGDPFIFGSACVSNVETVRWLAKWLGVTDEALRADFNYEALQKACRANKIGVVQWLVDHFHITRDKLTDGRLADMIRSACLAESLEMLQWVIRQFEVTDADAFVGGNVAHYAIRCATAVGKVDFARRLVEAFELADVDLAQFAKVADEKNDAVERERLEMPETASAARSASKQIESADEEKYALAPEEVRAEEDRLLAAGDVAQLQRWYDVTPSRHCSKKPALVLLELCRRSHKQAAVWSVGYFHMTAEQVLEDVPCVLRTSCGHGNVETVEWLFNWLGVTEEDLRKDCNYYVLHEACGNGNLGVAQWLAKRFDITRDKLRESRLSGMMWSACMCGNLELLQWFVEQFAITKADTLDSTHATFESTCSKGRLDIVEWLVKRFDITRADVLANKCRAVTWSIGFGCPNVATWLLDKFGMTFADVPPFELLQSFQSASVNNHFESVKLVLPHLDVDDIEDRYSAFRSALVFGNDEFARYLIDEFDLSPRKILDQFAKAFNNMVANGRLQTIKWLEERYGNVDVDEHANNNQLLCAVCLRGATDTLRWLFEKFKFTADDVRGQPIASACTHNHVETVRMLIDYFALTAKDLGEQTPRLLREARMAGRTRLLQLLVDRFGSPELPSPSPAQQTAKPVVSADMIYKAEYDCQGRDRVRSIFVRLCEEGLTDNAIWFYMKNGIKYADLKSDNHASLRKACANDHMSTVEWLLRVFYRGYYCDHRRLLADLLVDAARDGRLSTVQWLHKNIIYLHEDILDCRGPLYAACKSGHVRVLQWLVKAYWISAKRLHDDRHHNLLYTLVRKACEQSNSRIVRWLIEHFYCASDVVPHANIIEALRIACRTGDVSIIRCFVDRLDFTTDDICRLNLGKLLFRCTPLGETCESGNLTAVQYLVERFGLTADDVRANKNAALGMACVSGNVGLAQWLATNFDLTAADARDGNNWALRWTCVFGKLEMLRWLVETFGLTVEDARAKDNHALRMACQGRHTDIGQYLVDRFGLKVEDARACNNGALHEACFHADLKTVQWLVQTFGLTGDDVRANDNDAVVSAFSRGKLATGEWLVKTFKLTRNDVFAQDRRALSLAKSCNFHAVVQWLDKFAYTD